MVMSPGTYLRKRREAAGMSIDDVASMVGSVPHLDMLGRAEWIRMVEADTQALGADVIQALRYTYAFDAFVLAQLVEATRNPDCHPPRVCRVCACSQFDPCVDENLQRCSWIGDELCSEHEEVDDGEGGDEMPITSIDATSTQQGLAARGPGTLIIEPAPEPISPLFDYGNGVVCYLMDGEYYIYGITRGPRIAHSEGAARSIAAGAA